MIEKKVACSDLRPGMFVSRLDRPWLETPFVLEGFQVEFPEDVANIRQHCEYVFIDVERGDDVNSRGGSLDAAAGVARKPGGWQEQTATDLELPAAKQSVQSVTAEIEKAFAAAGAGADLSLRQLKKKISELVDSVLRNSDASLLLARLKRKDDYAYNHAIGVSVLSVALGKRLSFNLSELRTLALCGSLFDIGKVNIPDGLLTKEGSINAAEVKVLRHHVEFGVDILSKAGAVPTVIEVAHDHHERHDGSGYPTGKSGGDIPVFAQIVGLADTYDAMISNRVYRGAMSHETAVRELYDMRGSVFNAEILEQFIQCLGTYPAGSLVELTTGEVAIVMQQNQVRRLRPQVMLILDSDKNPLESFPIINLLSETEDNLGRWLAIAKSLDPGSYGIEPAEYFI